MTPEQSGVSNTLHADRIQSGNDTTITQNNYHYPLPKLPIDGIDERRGRADWALLSKLWDLVNTQYIDRLDEETQQGMIDYKEYQVHIYEYLESRNQPQNRFHHPDLESAFTEFDEVLKQYLKKVRPAFTASFFGDKQWYMSEEREAKLIDHRWLTENEYQIVQQRFSEVVDQSMMLLRQSKRLTSVIRSIVPDFFAD